MELLAAAGALPARSRYAYVENKAAQTSASWLSGGLFQRQIVLQAARSFESAAWAVLGALAGPIGLDFDKA